ncbi:hypothetical protein F2P56_023983 [Juglans regia]|nr:hypothetical protein F2P56_023983 [Juglans regia]
MCREQRITGMDVETDSLMVVKWITGAKCEVWYLEDFWEEILKILREGDYTIQHVFQEGNALANYLARLVHGNKIEYIRRGKPEFGFVLFESESLKWPEFDDVNGNVLTYFAQDRAEIQRDAQPGDTGVSAVEVGVMIGINAYAQLKFMKGFSADAKMMYVEASQVANDAVGSIRIVASFCAEEKVMNLYRSKCEGPRKAGIKQGLITGTGYGTSFGLLFLAYATFFYAGAQLVEAGKATSSDVFQVFFALTMVATGVSQTSSMGPDTGKAKNAVSSIFAIIDQQSKIDASDESGITLDNFKGGIEFRHVSFKYPCRPDVQIFHDLSLTIHSNKTVALVGESGSGKSIVISLLQRF